MTTSAFSFLFAALALCCLAAVVLVATAALVRQVRSDSAVLDGLRVDLGAAALALGALVAATAMAGSLYYSNVVGFTPCTLCWYQRICMYPLALLLTIAAVRRDRAFWVYALPVAAIGAVISAYHSWIQAFPPASGTSFCTMEAPCTTRHVWEFGFVSIPFMALCGFSFIITMMLLARPTASSSSPAASPAAPMEASRVEPPEHPEPLVDADQAGARHR